MKTNLEFNFNNKTVLIIGGSKGIGLELVKQYAISGSKVYYVSRSKIVNDQKSYHLPCDLSSKSDLENLEKNLGKLKKVDILINSAAINFSKSIADISLDEWEKVININLNSIFLITKKVIELMKVNGEGSIVNISSIAGRHRSIVSGSHYVSSKAALIGFTRQLSYECAKFNIRVNAVCPSQTYTEMLSKSMTKQEILDLEKNIPLNRIANVEEQVWPIMFLTSGAASYITGTILDVNGGQI